MSELRSLILESKTMKRQLKESRLHEEDSTNDSKDEGERLYREMMGKMRANATYKKIEALCKETGYKLGYGLAHKEKNGHNHFELRISEDSNYRPRIYFSNDRFGQRKPIFEIQTTAYGALELAEYEKFLEGCHDAHKLVSELLKIDLTTLYDPREDYPQYYD